MNIRFFHELVTIQDVENTSATCNKSLFRVFSPNNYSLDQNKLHTIDGVTDDHSGLHLEAEGSQGFWPCTLGDKELLRVEHPVFCVGVDHHAICGDTYKMRTKPRAPGKVVLRALVAEATVGSSWAIIALKLGTVPCAGRPERPVETNLFVIIEKSQDGLEWRSDVLQSFTENSAQFNVGWLDSGRASTNRNCEQGRGRRGVFGDHLLNLSADSAVSRSAIGLHGVWEGWLLSHEFLPNRLVLTNVEEVLAHLDGKGIKNFRDLRIGVSRLPGGEGIRQGDGGSGKG